ncbi:ABC transporter permease [Salinicoccus sp. YB14-2]|uniref:ABC transporter permease n=1 Tax=Salinicoccus sp. YB14-2 TaxID=1572701 RepID=UPI00068A8B80|nr:ABC transporter permease [Salinicoccus sp. YB14-2]
MLNSLILKNFIRNIKNYALYIFALIFSVSLFFSLVLLSLDDAASAEISGNTGLSSLFMVGSVVVVIIISLFVMFANRIFIKRRHKELALYQLIGMNRFRVFRILALENFMIYFGSLIGGILLGFFISRLLLMLLLRIMKVDMLVNMSFSFTAVWVTAAVFVVIFIVLMIQNYIFLRGSSLIKLLKLNKTSETAGKPVGIGTVIMGIIGFGMVGCGYYISSILFESAMENPYMLPINMLIILFLTIVGTYITFKFSVTFVLNLIRRFKGGHVNVSDVLSITSVMFKMRSNAFLLTVITVITAIAITAMSLSYISYYSTDKMLNSSDPYDYTFSSEEGMEFYEEMLNDEGIEIERIEKSFIHFDLEPKNKDEEMNTYVNSAFVASDNEFDGFDVDENESYVTGQLVIQDMFSEFEIGEQMTFTDGKDFSRTVEVADVDDQAVIPSNVSYGLPVVILDDGVYQQLYDNQSDSNEQEDMPTDMYAFNIAGGDSSEIYEMMDDEDNPPFSSKLQSYEDMVKMTGMLTFIIGFLGFAFLLTSGCILYFKQIDECENEKGSYKVLRKLGFREGEILRGLAFKMGITFGIPLIIGLLHTYFAVKSGWFIFGIEMLTPMLIVMGVYTLLYSIFAVISLGYYKKVVRASI